ncbi:hypothetical protein VTK56DRAFT_4281 [Thermocarpiscus australiensis]
MADFIAVAASNPATTGSGRDGTMPSAAEPSDSMSGPATKRLACESCRDRKIRCDRQHPTCGRCARMRNTCRYSTRSKSTLSNSDLSRYLVEMSQRLQQIEAKFAFHANGIQRPLPTPPRDGPGQDESTVTLTQALPAPLPPRTSRPSIITTQALAPSHANPNLLSSTLDLFDLGMAPEEMPVPSEYSTSEWSDPVGNDGHSRAEFNMDPFPMQLDHDSVTSPLMAESHQPFQFDPMPTDISPSSSSHNLPGLSSSLLHGLHDRYFDLFHPILPMISRERFEADLAEASQASSSIGVHALSWAMATLGSSSIPELRGYVDRCYERCRALLELCERQDTGECLTSLSSLQALVLLTLYEFKQSNFARPWMTLGRAIRLAKMMGLDQGACCLSAAVGATQYGPSLPPPASAADAEERRRTYWVLFVLDCLSTMQTNARPALERPTHIPLPYSTDYPDRSSESRVPMPPVQRIFDPDIPDDISLSPFAGTVVMVWLYRRYIEHMASQLSQDASFWEIHYAIEKDIVQCKTKLLARYIDGDRADDPCSLTLRMNLAAVEISLHQTALAKVETSKLPAALAADATSKCASAATDIAKAVQMGKSLTGKKLESFRQQDRFLVWPMTTAALVLGRLLERKDEVGAGAHGIGFALRVLGRAMRDLLRPEHVRPGLMDKIDAWLEGKSCSPEREAEDEAE